MSQSGSMAAPPARITSTSFAIFPRLCRPPGWRSWFFRFDRAAEADKAAASDWDNCMSKKCEIYVKNGFLFCEGRRASDRGVPV